jgi:hypothetical protein
LEFCVSETSVFFDFPDIFYGIDGFYPLVNVYIAMENFPFIVIVPLKMVIFHGYVK